MEGCSNLGAFVLCSNTLSTLWLSDLHSLSKMVFNLPNVNEISLDFSRQENDSTGLTSMMDGLGRSCPKLKKYSHRFSSSFSFCCAFCHCCAFKGIAHAITCTWIRNYRCFSCSNFQKLLKSRIT